MWTVSLEFVPFLGLLGYIVAFLLAFSGTKWWKAAIIEAFIDLILGFAVSFLRDPGADKQNGGRDYDN